MVCHLLISLKAKSGGEESRRRDGQREKYWRKDIKLKKG